MQCSGRRKWPQAQLGTQAAKTRARARGSEAQSGLTTAVALAAVTALVTAKARKCSGRLCYGSGRDRNAHTGALTAALVATLMNGGSGSDGSGRGRKA